MRAPVLASLASVVLVAACGRVGYDTLGGDDGIDAAVDDARVDDAEIDAPGAPPGVLTTCGDAVLVQDFGPAQSASFYGLDVAATSTGFVVAWSAGADMIRATGLAVNSGPRLEVIQLSADIVSEQDAVMSIAAIGDDAMLGVDDPGGPGIWLFALDERGLERSTTKYIDTARAYGHDFVMADPVSDIFVVMGANGTSTASEAYTRDHDIHPLTGPHAAFTVGTESAAAVKVNGGYMLMTGNSSNCDVKKVDAAFAAVGSPQPVNMTCHHASLAAPVGSNNVVAGWNCDNDAVWVTAGDLSGALPGERAVYGDSSNSASNPRLAVTNAGVWYGFQVTGGRLGVALVDATGAVVAGNDAAVVHTSANLRAYDLAVWGNVAFLFWLDSSTRTELWAMKLCGA